MVNDLSGLMLSTGVMGKKARKLQKNPKNQRDFLFCLLDNTTHKTYIMMEARLGALFKSESEYTILDK